MEGTSTINRRQFAHLKRRNFESLEAIRDHLELSHLKEEEDIFALKSRTLQKLHRFCILAPELH